MSERIGVPRQNDYWRKAEVAQLCRVSVRTVENWMAYHGLPHYRIGNVVLFKPQDVRDFLEGKRRVLRG
jgi:excisionase family DNA binding protein